MQSVVALSMEESNLFGEGLSHGVALKSDQTHYAWKFNRDNNGMRVGVAKSSEGIDMNLLSVSPLSDTNGEFSLRNSYSRLCMDSSILDIESSEASVWQIPGMFSDDKQSSQVALRSQRLSQQRRIMEDKVSHHLEMLRISQQRQNQEPMSFLSEPSLSKLSIGLSANIVPVNEESFESNSLAKHLQSFNHSASLSDDSTGSQHHQNLRVIYQVQFKRYVRFYTICNGTDKADISLSSLSSASSSFSSSFLPLPVSSPSTGSTQSSSGAPLRVNIGDFVIVNADRGEDMGIVTTVMTMQEFIDRRLAMSAKSNIQEEDAVIGTILRVASLLERQQLPKKYKKEEAVVKAAKELAYGTYQLPLTIHDADYQLDGNKLTVFYSSDARVDFRDYVKDLFTLFKTRIWMKKDPRMLLRNDSHGTSFSLLGYVFDDNAAIALMTGMQIAMEPSHLSQRRPPHRQPPASLGHGNIMYAPPPPPPPSSLAGYPAAGNYIHYNRQPPTLPPYQPPPSRYASSHHNKYASPVATHRQPHQSSTLIPPDARFLYTSEDKQPFANVAMKAQQKSFLY